MVGRIESKVALVTGGAAGIGEGVVRRFAQEGALVIFSDTDAQLGQALEQELVDSGYKVTFCHAHMNIESEAQRFVELAKTKYGRVDILVNNAGIRLYQTIVDATEESWDQILGVNLKAAAFTARAAITEMRKNGGGSIVNMSSNRSTIAGKNTVQYDTTKAALSGMTRSMAHDHASEGIRVNAVCPGPVFTQFHERRAATMGKSVEEFRSAFGRGSMMKRAGTVEEIANCVLFLASDEASYVTAASLYVDGGLAAVDADTLTPWLNTIQARPI